MLEIETLKSMALRRKKRLTNLIVPLDRLLAGESIDADRWEFSVPFAFKDALDIQYSQRIKDKRKHMVWTQGPCIAFKEGDLLHAKSEKYSVQVKYAAPMGWDSDNNSMYAGSVLFDLFEINEGKYQFQYRYQTSQIKFLEFVIAGREILKDLPSIDRLIGRS